VKRWKFIKFNGKSQWTPSLLSVSWNINAMRVLWPLCKDLGFEYLLPRRFTQDPLENLIGGMRDACGNNRKPITSQVQAGFTSLLLYNLEDRGKFNRNCEQDDNSLCAIGQLLKDDFAKNVSFYTIFVLNCGSHFKYFYANILFSG
jgi:hypothetical protein